MGWHCLGLTPRVRSDADTTTSKLSMLPRASANRAEHWCLPTVRHCVPALNSYEIHMQRKEIQAPETGCVDEVESQLFSAKVLSVGRRHF